MNILWRISFGHGSYVEHVPEMWLHLRTAIGIVTRHMMWSKRVNAMHTKPCKGSKAPFCLDGEGDTNLTCTATLVVHFNSSVGTGESQ